MCFARWLEWDIQPRVEKTAARARRWPEVAARASSRDEKAVWHVVQRERGTNTLLHKPEHPAPRRSRSLRHGVFLFPFEILSAEISEAPLMLRSQRLVLS